MRKSEYHVATSEISGAIYAGKAHIEDEYIEWKDKSDVTKEAIDAVIAHMFFCIPENKTSIIYKAKINNMPISLTLTKE